MYTEALSLDESAVLYSNRSAAYLKAKRYILAIDDAEKAIELKPDWSKGYSRKATALCYLDRYEEAKIAYEEAVKLDPDNEQLKKDMEEAEAKLTGPGGSSPIGNPFAQPDVMAKLEANSQTRDYLKDPGFRKYLQLLQQSPSAMQNMNDPRLITCLGVLLGINLQTMGMEDNDSFTTSEPSDRSSSEPKTSSQAKTSSNSKSSSKPDTELTGEKKQALAAKEKGNAAYKSKNFDEAITYYDQAIKLDPTDMTYLNNKAAVYFEKQEYDECIKTCEKAVEIGRENRADFTVIAKAFARIGKSYMKKDDDENALKYLNKSISEHRTADVTKLVVEIQKQIKEKERLAYVNPELALEMKEQGNEEFLKGHYPNAIKHYNEAIKRNPEDAKLYSNRAACYSKLMEFNLALKDCEDCIKLDPNFVKGYLRKGSILTAMKEHTKAAQCFTKALELDPNNAEAQQGYRNSVVAESSDPEAVRKRAMENPEVQQILADPAMRLILEQMQKDPNALKEHLKNPDVAAKIEKLLECGIIAIR